MLGSCSCISSGVDVNQNEKSCGGKRGREKQPEARCLWYTVSPSL